MGLSVIPRLLIVAIFLFSGAAHAQAVWGPTGRDPGTSVQASGDPLAPDGARVLLSAKSVGPQGFAGAITALDATPLRGREVELSGLLKVSDGPGPAALWLRADGPQGPLAFLNTAKLPVNAADGAQVRSLRLYVPVGATGIKLGTTLRGIGTVEASSVKLVMLSASSGTASAQEVLEAAIATMRAHALHADRIDWPSESARLLGPGLENAPAQEAHVAIARLLKALGDRHSFLQSAADAAEQTADAVASHAPVTRVSGGIGYLRVPGLRGTNEAAGTRFSVEFCDALTQGAADAPQGWIVDLRGNIGGNMWPMLAGLRPLLGDGPTGSFRDSAGQVTPWSSKPDATCTAPLAASPVAVLIGPATASSGEAVAMAFKGRANTRLFGQTTAGVATSNRGFPLPDGSVLMLTTAVFLDRSGLAYPEGIKPDTPVDDGDDAVAAAETWLRSQGRS